MFDLRNHTPFAAAAFPSLDVNARDRVTVVVKGTYDIVPGARPSRSPAPLPIVPADQYLGDPGKTSVVYESDFCPFKPSTDIVLVGSAHAPGGKAVPFLDVTLQVGDLKKTLRVFGNRRWKFGRLSLSPKMTRPEPFTKMPIIYERAFGGADPGGPRRKKVFWERRNPIGAGFAIRHSRKWIHGRPAPNIEDPAHLIRSWRSKPQPQGFGFIGRSWMPRLKFGGTYDDAWKEKRCPLLPGDFDERYFQGAHPDLVAPDHLAGDEPVALIHLSPAGDLRFTLPGDRIEVSARIGRKDYIRLGRLDTVVLLADEGKLILVWRALFTEFRSPWDILRLGVDLRSDGQRSM